MTVDVERIERIGRELLEAIGEDPDREGLIDTPARWARSWKEFADYNPGKCETAFTEKTYNGLVVLGGFSVWTLCEHHLLPFQVDLAIAYFPEGKVLGLSKLARIAHYHAHKLQLQERLVTDIADQVSELSGSKSVGVVGRGRHLCMAMRGVMTPGQMYTESFRGPYFGKYADLREAVRRAVNG